MERRPDELKMVTEEVDGRFGVTAVCQALERRGQFPAIYFQRVRGSELPVVVNLTATYERLALALGTNNARKGQVAADRPSQPVPPHVVDSGPVKEVVWTGAEASLARLPIPTHNALDGGPYLTGASLVARDPVSGVLNVGLYRHQIHGPDRMGVWFIPGHHGEYIRQRYEELKRPMPVALIVGHH